jgi:CubicO group peptidase (beta-lactamase class C family)
MSVATLDGVIVEGHVSPGFEAVREVFAGNFVERGELGGACCVYHNGRKIVDLWGGSRNKHPGEPWERDTMVLVWSASKGLAAMTLAVAHSRGWLDYDERVATYWPEFAQHGKGGIRRVCLRSTNRSTRPSSLISIAWRSCSRARHLRGRQALARLTTLSPSGSMRAR